ncbi:phosphate ABC transporter permease subunit PstC [Synechococcus sp. CS-197]|uniref:phosphate ABC transporter permease subunit PstC n=1 Tax=Synechococcus sp. CS-197 TaxID=2847985 RepID=UPI0001525290|nr:phosphate ABC transporter permease subunit PstC [Synechococcus sp. CS-197]MCT0252096.1 phosphate ABC transporter permease subunit PstC [Synechococcus sp. CS-197]PTT98565.1 phosphate ABC transporter permease subunit PstC [Pseudomonas sp. HMWF031]CAK23671.1 ABC-type phosphate transport system permease component [Synechococcus sp. WH 7803]
MSESKELYLLRRRPPSEKVVDVSFKYLAVTLASMVAVVLFAILIVVFWGSLESMGRYGLKFLVTSNWNPVDDEYGAFTAIYGTIVTSMLSLLIAVPLGVGTAVFITENIIPLRIRNVIGVMVELLAAIPSVVLGLWAIFVMEPFIRPFLEFLYATFEWLPIFSSPPIGPGTAPAILILVVMILPIITSISRDSLNQVPDKLRQAAYGVGTTRWGAVLNVLLPAAISGIVGGVMLALGRAMGETMAVTMIIGNSNNFSPSLLAPGNTIAAMLANQFGEADGSQVSSLMYAAFILMILSLAVNVFAQWLVKRLSLKY